MPASQQFPKCTIGRWFGKKPPNGHPGAAIKFSVAWYDEEFFQEKKDVYLGKEHLRMFAGFGNGTPDVEVKHFVLAA